VTDVDLFVPCFVDLFASEVAVATARLLRRAGCRVRYPRGQTCCGQPAFNAGFPREARRLARRWRRLFARSKCVVTPSGSCAAMVSRFFPELLGPGGPPVFELSQFLVDELGAIEFGARFSGRVGWHDGCHPRRELGIEAAPRRLLGAVEGLELVELDEPDRCCGFGGTFAVDYDEVSRAMADRKLESVRAASVDALVSTESSCLMHLKGRIERVGGGPEVLHLAEILDGATGGAAGERR
jgi:L-lactate dehydrogenase complex protein LldE